MSLLNKRCEVMFQPADDDPSIYIEIRDPSGKFYSYAYLVEEQEIKDQLADWYTEMFE